MYGYGVISRLFMQVIIHEKSLYHFMYVSQSLENRTDECCFNFKRPRLISLFICTMSSKSDPDASSLIDALIPNLPGSMYYIPNFITEDEESRLLGKVHYLALRIPYPRILQSPSKNAELSTLIRSMPYLCPNGVSSPIGVSKPIHRR